MSHKGLVQSWFGFCLGLFTVGLSIVALFETWSLKGILVTLGFLCFWYPWSQVAMWNKPLKGLFNQENIEAMSGWCQVSTLLAVVFLGAATVLGFIA